MTLVGERFIFGAALILILLCVLNCVEILRKVHFEVKKAVFIDQEVISKFTLKSPKHISVKKVELPPFTAKKTEVVKSEFERIYFTPNRMKTQQLPGTGSVYVDKISRENLPEWTAALGNKLSADKPVEQKKFQPMPKHQKEEEATKLVQLKVIDPEKAISEFGFYGRMEVLTENLCRWFLKKILLPLNEDIKMVTEAFGARFIEHLGPQMPAALSLFSPKSKDSSNGPGNSVFITTSSYSSGGGKPQTLIDLSQKYPTDQNVIKRIRIERYLAFASLGSTRLAVIKRLQQLSDGSQLYSLMSKWTIYENTFSTSTTTSIASTNLDFEEDLNILINLFCTYMDENMPSLDYYDQNAFSSKHFISKKEAVNANYPNLAIEHYDYGHFRLACPEQGVIYDTASGSCSFFHCVIFLVEYVHKNCKGFLGIGNLDSLNIGLVSILRR